MTQEQSGRVIPLQNEMVEMLFAATQEVFTSMLGSEIDSSISAEVSLAAWAQRCARLRTSS